MSILTTISASKYVEHFLSIVIPTCKLGNYWPSHMTIMMRMTSKMIKDIVDNVRPPTKVNLIWSAYTTDIEKINSTIRCLNIIDLTITSFINYDKKTVQKDDILKALAACQYQRENANNENAYNIKDKLLKLSEMISLNKKLTKLNLSSCGLHNNSLKYLKESFNFLNDLSVLNLYGNDFILTLDFIKILLSLPKLVSLDLSDNHSICIKIDKDKWNQNPEQWDLKPEETLQLENLSLNFSDIDQRSDNIFELIKKSPKLRSLDLGDNYLDHNSMNQFIESLGQCPNLTDLNISNNRIEDDLMKTLLQYLEQHHNLSNLDISGNIDWNYDEEYEGYEDFNAYIDSLKIRDIIKH
jgi:Ran GTPase-activating protein (RanGAP) involved in mRNA processing and transport